MLEADPAKAQNLGKAGREWLSQNSNDAQWLDNFDQILQNFVPATK
jgi:hypothetical protein